MTNDIISKYGPVALVTGASSGIGKSFAELLASKGLDLVVVARRVERLEELAAQLTKQHDVKVTVLKTDLADTKAAQQILSATSSLDVGLVVSNAGFGLRGPFETGDPAMMTEMLMVNTPTPMSLAHGFIPRLRSRGKGGIIFTSSVEGFMGMPMSAGYAATKAFMNNLGEGLWAELTPYNIDVLTLCPGATETEALTRAGMDAKSVPNVQSSGDVARLALENIQNGPTYIPNDHYRMMFERMLAMPRREALAASAKAMMPRG